MFGPRLTTVFASRWRAIWFAASMMLFAYCSVPQQSANAPVDGSDALAQAALDDSPFAPDTDGASDNTDDMSKALDSDDMKRLQDQVAAFETMD